MSLVRTMFLVLMLIAATVAGAAAQTVCTSAGIAAQEANCPASGTCVITKTFTVAPTAPATSCTLDFGDRLVVMTATARLNIGSGLVVLNAGNFTMQATAAAAAFIDGRGASAPPLNNGGSITINASGAITMLRNGSTRSRIDVSGNQQGGTVRLTAGGAISISGRLNADQLTANGSGGKLILAAGGNITSDAQAWFSATGGNQAFTGGGGIDMDAGGTLDLSLTAPSDTTGLDVTGSNGGTIDLSAAGDVLIRGLRGNATGESGSAATITIEAEHNVQILGAMALRGGELDPLAGGEGGSVSISADFGDITFGTSADIQAEGSGPDGDGGDIDISAAGSLILMAGADISARSNGLEGVGGSVAIEVDQGVTTAALIDVAGGAGGGGICIDAGGSITLGGGLDARGYGNGGSGGDIEVGAGVDGLGSLTIQDLITVNGGSCGIEEGCGDGGTTNLSGCDVTVTSTGSIVARAPGTSGEHTISARGLLRVDGNISALKTIVAGADGSVTLEHRAAQPPVIRPGSIAPAAAFQPRETCSPSVQVNCLAPCPVCGNNIVEFPETCDGGNADNCDGCSSFCQIETCAPGVPCVTCDAHLGCPACPERPTGTPTETPTGRPTATPTATRTDTRTVSPTRTPTETSVPTPSGQPTSTPTATAQATFSPTATATAPPTLSATPSPSDTPTATMVATPTSTQTPLPTETETSTPTATELPSETPTMPPSCVGDCGLDGEVTVDELLTMVNIALETAPTAACPPGDANGDGEVTIDEILTAVNNTLLGCM